MTHSTQTDDELVPDGDTTAADVPVMQPSRAARPREHAAAYAVVRVDGFHQHDDWASQALEVVQEAAASWRAGELSTAAELHRFLAQWRADTARGHGQEGAAAFGRPRTSEQPSTVLPWARRALPWARRVKPLSGHHVSWVPSPSTGDARATLPIYRKAFTVLLGGAPATLCVLLRPVAPDELPGLAPAQRALLVDGIHRPDPALLPRLFQEVDARAARVRDASTREEAFRHAALCHWLLVQGQPLQRGNAAVADLFARVLLEARGFMVPPWVAGVVPGLEALTTEEEAFAAAWPGLLEALPGAPAVEPKPRPPFADPTGMARAPSITRVSPRPVATEAGARGEAAPDLASMETSEVPLAEVSLSDVLPPRGPTLGAPPRVTVRDLRRSLEEAQENALPFIPAWDAPLAVQRGLALVEPYTVRAAGTRKRRPLGRALQQHAVLTPAQGDRILWHAGCAAAYLQARGNAVDGRGAGVPEALRARQVEWERLAWRGLVALIPERLAALQDLCLDFPLNREDHERAALMAVYADFGRPFLFPDLDEDEQCVRAMHVLLARELGLTSASTVARHLRARPELSPLLLRVVDDVTAFMGWPPDARARRVIERIAEAQAGRQPEGTRPGRPRDAAEREQSRARALDTLRQRLAHPYRKLITTSASPESTSATARLGWAHLDRTHEVVALGREELVLLADAGLREWRVPNPSDRATRLAMAAQVAALFGRGPVMSLVAGSRPSAPHPSILASVEGAVGHPGSPFPALAGLDLPAALDGLNAIHDDEIVDVLLRMLQDTHAPLRQVQERFDEHLLRTYAENPLLKRTGLAARLDRLRDQPDLLAEFTARFPGWHSASPVDARSTPDEVAYYLDLRAAYTAHVVEAMGFGNGRLALGGDAA